MNHAALELTGVGFIRDARTLLADIDLVVERGERWALVGPNGAGKSTLLNVCGAVTFPSRGAVRIMGHRLGEVDLRELRRSIGFVNARHPLRSDLSAEEVVLTGATGTIELVPRREPTPAERERAQLLMKTLGVPIQLGLHWHTMSQGERGRTLIARALMTDPPLLLLDEPSTGLDVAAREQMIQTLDGLPDAISGLTMVMVTHHFEELPTGTTHAALLRDGRLVAAGPIDEILTSGLVSTCFAHPIRVRREHGRWMALAH